MRRLLLVSTSTTFGTGYLEHCAPRILDLFRSCKVGHVLFVPYALSDHDGYEEKARHAFVDMGLGLDSIHHRHDAVAAIEEAEGIFIGGGNTFRLLKSLQDLGLVEAIRSRVGAGLPYLGTSAGSNVACPTIRTTNDMPIVYPASFDALDLVPFQINPHYLDEDPGSRHMGESRATRLREYLEENSRPVVALREGSMLAIEGDRVTLWGEPGGLVFALGTEPIECASGCCVDELLVRLQS